MSLSPLSIQRLTEVKEAILTHPHLYEQEEPFVPDLTKGHHLCNTPGCILGYAIALFGRSKEAGCGHMLEEGARVLDIDETQAERLFHAAFGEVSNRFLHGLYKTYQDATPNSTKRAQCAAKRIDHFIATEGRE